MREHRERPGTSMRLSWLAMLGSLRPPRFLSPREFGVGAAAAAGSRNRLRRLLAAMVVPYAVGSAAWDILDRTEVAQWWPFQLADVFNVWFYLPVPVLMLAAWLCRDRRSGVWLMLPLLLFVGDYGSLFLPRSAEAQGTRLRVMTANLHYLNGDARAFGNLLREQRPDVVAIQELGTAISVPLGDGVRDLYPYQLLRPSTDVLGMGILSRHPIRDSSRSEMAPDCSCQQVTIEVDGRLVTILNVHPLPPTVTSRRWGRIVVPTGFSTADQRQAILGIEARARASGGPLLIMGDLNATDREQEYSILGRRYRDAYREAGWGFGFTFPSWRRPFSPFSTLIRIDYVFHDDSWVANAARVVDIPGSDHRGVMAEVTLRREQMESAWAADQIQRSINCLSY